MWRTITEECKVSKWVQKISIFSSATKERKLLCKLCINSAGQLSWPRAVIQQIYPTTLADSTHWSSQYVIGHNHLNLLYSFANPKKLSHHLVTLWHNIQTVELYNFSSFVVHCWRFATIQCGENVAVLCCSRLQIFLKEASV